MRIYRERSSEKKKRISLSLDKRNLGSAMLEMTMRIKRVRRCQKKYREKNSEKKRISLTLKMERNLGLDILRMRRMREGCGDAGKKRERKESGLR